MIMVNAINDNVNNIINSIINNYKQYDTFTINNTIITQ